MAAQDETEQFLRALYRNAKQDGESPEDVANRMWQNARGVSRRELLQAGAGVGVGAALGGGGAYAATGKASADPSTSDSDGNVGTPSNPVDVFAEGIDSNSISTERASIGPNGRDWGDRVDLFVVGGQSNAEGRGDSTKSPSLSADVAQYYNGSSLSALEDPVGDADTGSAWPEFAQRYYELTGIPTVWIEEAEGASAQHKDADNGNGHWDDGGSLRGRLATAVDDTLSHLNSQGYDARFRGIAWSQGERDAAAIKAGNLTKSQYKTALEDMIAYYDGQFSNPWELLIFQTGHKINNDHQGYQDVRAAQREVAESVDNASIVSDVQQDFPERGLVNTSDNIHYLQPGLNEMGRIGAETFVAGGQRQFRDARVRNGVVYGDPDIWGDVQSAIDYAANRGYQTVEIPGGTHGAITVSTAGITVRALDQSPGGTVFDGGTSNHGIVVSGADVRLEGLTAQTTAGGGSAKDAIQLNATAQAVNCHVSESDRNGLFVNAGGCLVTDFSASGSIDNNSINVYSGSDNEFWRVGAMDFISDSGTRTRFDGTIYLGSSPSGSNYSEGDVGTTILDTSTSPPTEYVVLSDGSVSTVQ